MLTQDEKNALLELKAQGYTFSDAMGFIASTRMGNTSKVERELTTLDKEIEPPSDAGSDLSRGFSNAKQSFSEGLDRQNLASQRSTKAGRVSGTLGAGFRAAGEAIGSLIGGGIRAIPGGTTVMNKVDDVVGSAVDKTVTSKPYKGLESGFKKLPTGVQQTIGDVGNVAMGALGIAEPLVAPGATRALAQGIKTFAETGIKEVGQQGINKAITTGLEPEALMQRVARVSKGKQTKFEERAGESIGTYLVKRGIYGDPENITEQLYTRMQASKNRVDAGIAQIGGTYKNNSVQDALEQLAEREAKVSSLRTPSKDTDQVNKWLAKNSKDGLTLTEINAVKRMYERNIKLDYIRDNVSDGIARANNIDAKLRDFVEKTADASGFPVVRELNKETFLAKQLLDDLGAEYAGQQGNNFVSLSDAFFLAEAASNPTALAAFGLKKAFSSKSAMSAVARLMAKNRKVQDLPSGSIVEPKLLPAPSANSPRSSISSGSVIESGGMTDRGLVNPGITERTVPGAIKRSDSDAVETPITKLENARKQSVSEIETEMTELSRAGFRVMLPHDATQTGSPVIAAPSTFPKWVPESYREKELFDKVWENINENKAPRANATREIELQSIVEKEIKNRMNEIMDKPESNSGIFDNNVPFGLALTGAGYYYLTTEDGSAIPLLAVGMISPTGRSAALKQIESHASTLRRKIAILEDAGKVDSAAYKQLIKAHDAAIVEKLKIQNFEGKNK